MKEIYNELTIEVVLFKAEDIIATSGEYVPGENETPIVGPGGDNP